MINAEKHSASDGIKIKKLKLRPSAGRVFYRVYEKGNPSRIPQIKAEVKEVLSQSDRSSRLVYRVLKDRLVFLGHVGGGLSSTEIERAIVSEIFAKLKRIILEIVGREMSESRKFISRSSRSGKGKFSGEIKDISKKDAAREIGVSAGDFEENTISGEVHFTGK